MSRAQIERLRAMLASRPQAATLEERRAGFERMAAQFSFPPGTSAEAFVAGDAQGLWVWTGEPPPDRAILWLHGGQFVLGSSTSYRSFGARLSSASGARVLLLDYPLAPEHPFPQALQTIQGALQSLREAGVGASHLVIGGDSAGANLALAATQAQRATGEAPPAGLVLLSPYLDLTHSGTSIAARSAQDPFVDPDTMGQVAGVYLAGADPRDPRASPLFGSMAGAPPTLIQVGEHEALFDDARRCADRLLAAGAQVTFQEWAGMIHVFPLFADLLDEGDWALRQMGLWIEQRIF